MSEELILEKITKILYEYIDESDDPTADIYSLTDLHNYIILTNSTTGLDKLDQLKCQKRFLRLLKNADLMDTDNQSIAKKISTILLCENEDF